MLLWVRLASISVEPVLSSGRLFTNAYRILVKLLRMPGYQFVGYWFWVKHTHIELTCFHCDARGFFSVSRYRIHLWGIIQWVVLHRNLLISEQIFFGTQFGNDQLGISWNWGVKWSSLSHIINICGKIICPDTWHSFLADDSRSID